MNFRLTLTLAIVMLALAIGFFLMPAKKADETVPSSTTPLLATQPADLNTISLVTDGVETLRFVRSGKDWSMAAPVKSSVTPFQMQNVVDALKKVSFKQKFEPEATGFRSAEATGTAKPDRLIKFTDDGNHEYTLGFGKETVDGIYATLNGAKTIYLVDRLVLDSLDKKPDDFRDKNISHTDPAKITAVTIKSEEGTVMLEKSGDKWLIAAPIHGRADSKAVEEIVGEMANITASGFTKLKRSDVRLDQPVATLTIQVLGDTAPVPPTPPATAAASNPSASRPATTSITLQLGVYTDIAKKAAVYAAIAGSDSVFTLRTDSFNKLNRQLQGLRDTSVTPAPVAQATEFSVRTDDKLTVALTRKDDKWTLTSSTSPVAGDTFAINEFLGALRDEKAIKYVDNAGDLKSIGLDPPHVKIELSVPGQSQREVILVGRPEITDKVTPMMRQGEPTVYLVQTAEAEKLAVSNLALRDKTIEALLGDRIRGIEISGKGSTGGGVELTREGTHWSMTQGAGGKSATADEMKVSALLADFTPIAATRYLDEKAPEGEPQATVKLTIVEPTLPSPATALATATAPGTATAPATMSALMPLPMIGPDRGQTVYRTLRLYKQDAGNAPTWRAVWAEQTPPWTFQPPQALVDHVTRETYAVPPATQPATSTAPATQP